MPIPIFPFITKAGRLAPIAVTSLLFSLNTVAHADDIALSFDEIGQMESISNLADPHLNPPFLADAAEITGDFQKFGEGSLRILQNRTVMTQLLVEDDWHEAFAGEIEQMTIALWLFIPADSDGAARILSRQGGSGANDILAFMLFGGHNPYFRLIATTTDGSSFDDTVTTSDEFAVARDQWTHVAMTYDSGAVAFYVDGFPVHSGFTETVMIPAQESENRKALRLQLLSLPAGSHVDDFLWLGDEALDPDEIKALSDEGLKVFMEGRVDS